MQWPPVIPPMPPMLSALFAAIIQRIGQITLVDSKTIRTTRDDSGTTANLWASAGDGAGVVENSGAVLLKKVGDTYVAGVNPYYFLQQPIVAGSTPVELAVTGKLSSFAASDPWWLATFENDYFWIEGTVTFNQADSAYVQSYGLGGSEGGGQIENDGADPAAQSKFRIFLAKIVGDGSGGLRVQPMAGAAHMLGIVFGDSKDSGGGNQVAITGVIGGGM